MLNTTKVLISKTLIDSYINHDKFVSVNNVLQEDNEMKQEIENPKNAVEYTTYIVMDSIVSVVRKILWTKIQVSEKLNSID